MSDTVPVIRLDRSKVFSEVHGERTPEDPHYHVHYWQGGKVGNAIVLLPFDANGLLVPDDGRKEPFMGMGSDSKPVEYRPLYNQAMRDMLERRMKRLAVPAAAADAETDETPGEGEPGDMPGNDGVNLESWLRGEAQYQPHQIKSAFKERYHRNVQKVSEIVVELVLDEKLVGEDEVCPALAKHLPAKVAA
jgi:hypothetical protein